MNKNKRHSGSNGIIGGQQQGARKEPIGKKRKKQKLAGEKSNVDQVDQKPFLCFFSFSLCPFQKKITNALLKFIFNLGAFAH